MGQERVKIGRSDAQYGHMCTILRRTATYVGPILSNLGSFWRHSDHILGHFWPKIGPFLAYFGLFWPILAYFGLFWPFLPLCGAEIPILAYFDPFWSTFGAPLTYFGGLWPILEQLGPILGYFRQFSPHFDRILTIFRAILARFWRILPHYGLFWGVFWPFGALFCKLNPFWACFE